MIVKHYRDLLIWQTAMDVCRMVHILCKVFPDDQKFILTAQIQRAAISIPSNIAEGHSTGRTKAFNHFLSISLGSAAELETQLILAADFSYCSTDDTVEIFEKLDNLKRMIHGTRRSLMKRLDSPSNP